MIIKKFEIRCPSCGSEALYRYGKSTTGKQKYKCLICSRQFITNAKRVQIVNKPICSICGKQMYLYKREANFIKFRCSAYPKCRTYIRLENVLKSKED